MGAACACAARPQMTLPPMAPHKLACDPEPDANGVAAPVAHPADTARHAASIRIDFRIPLPRVRRVKSTGSWQRVPDCFLTQCVVGSPKFAPIEDATSQPRGATVRTLGTWILAVAVTVALHALPASASAAPQTPSRLNALARSQTTRLALEQVNTAVTAASTADLSRSLLRQYGSQMTGFQSDLLKLNLALDRPGVGVMLSSLARANRLSRSQVRLLRTYLRALGRNPAIAVLNREGRALKRHPATLAAALAAVDSQTPDLSSLPSGRQSALAASNPALSSVLASPAVRSSATAMRQILSGPGGAKYLAALPPLTVVSLLPTQQVMSFLLPSDRAKAHAGRSRQPHAHQALLLPDAFYASLSPRAKAALELATATELLFLPNAVELAWTGLAIGAELLPITAQLWIAVVGTAALDMGIATAVTTLGAVPVLGIVGLVGVGYTLYKLVDALGGIVDVLEPLNTLLLLHQQETEAKTKAEAEAKAKAEAEAKAKGEGETKKKAEEEAKAKEKVIEIGGGTSGTGFVGEFLFHGFSAIGGKAPYTWSLGTEPVDGLTINHSTGLLGSVLAEKGEFKLSVSVHDNFGDSGSLEYTIDAVGI